MIGLLAHRFMRSAWGRYLMLGLAILAGASSESARAELTLKSVNRWKT